MCGLWGSGAGDDCRGKASALEVPPTVGHFRSKRLLGNNEVVSL